MFALSTLITRFGGRFRRVGNRSRKAHVVPPPRVYEVQPCRIGNTEHFVYRVVHQASGTIEKRTADLRVAELFCDQLNKEAADLNAIERQFVNRHSIARFVAQ